MFGLIYHTLNLQRLGLYAGWRYYWDGTVKDTLVTCCKDEINLLFRIPGLLLIK